MSPPPGARASRAYAASESSGVQSSHLDVSGKEAVSGSEKSAALPVFLPKSFDPPFEKTADEQDGKWIPLGDAERGELAARPTVVLYRSTVHPHRVSRFIKMDVVAIDLRRLTLQWVLGKKDVGAEQYAKQAAVGLIPENLQASAVAIFNGGFLARHGYWGVMSRDVTFVPPRDNGCTLGLYEDGAVDIKAWKQLGLSGLVGYRQAPPCLVENGTLHPYLLSGASQLWAGRSKKRKTRRRSAVGINADRTVLYYALGTETQAVDLARGLLAVGAQNALQLDINWNWTRFLLVGRRDDGQPRVTSTLIEDIAFGKNEYFSYPASRDFFFLADRELSVVAETP